MSVYFGWFESNPQTRGVLLSVYLLLPQHEHHKNNPELRKDDDCIFISWRACRHGSCRQKLSTSLRNPPSRKCTQPHACCISTRKKELAKNLQKSCTSFNLQLLITISVSTSETSTLKYSSTSKFVNNIVGVMTER